MSEWVAVCIRMHLCVCVCLLYMPTYIFTWKSIDFNGLAATSDATMPHERRKCDRKTEWMTYTKNHRRWRIKTTVKWTKIRISVQKFNEIICVWIPLFCSFITCLSHGNHGLQCRRIVLFFDIFRQQCGWCLVSLHCVINLIYFDFYCAQVCIDSYYMIVLLLLFEFFPWKWNCTDLVARTQSTMVISRWINRHQSWHVSYAFAGGW